MASFPALPSPYNPYVGEASQFARGAASIYGARQAQIAEGQRQAAALDRQRKNDEAAQQQRDLDNFFRAQRAGGYAASVDQPVPGTRPMGTGAPEPVTDPETGQVWNLPPEDAGGAPQMQRVPNPQIPQNPQGAYRTIGGESYYFPSEGEKARQKSKEKLEGGETFVPTGKLAEYLQQVGWDGKTPLTPAASHSLMQAFEALQPKPNAYQRDVTNFQNNGVPIPMGYDPRTNTWVPSTIQQQGATQMSGGGLPDGAFAMQAQA